MSTPAVHMSSPAESSAQSEQTLRQMIFAYRVSAMLHVAATLEIADHLSAGARSIDDLARLTQTHAPTLYRLLRALASQGIFVEGDPGYFSLTPLADLLRHDVNGNLRARSLFIGNPNWEAWSDLLYSVQTGEIAFKHHYGMSMWEYNKQHPESNSMMNDFFSSRTVEQANAILKAYDFSDSRTVMDIAGGQGTLIAAVLKAYPAARGILFDQPHVLENAPHVLKQAGVAERCEIIGGNFFEPLLAGADTILLKNILHDWEDEPARAILRNCYSVLPKDGRLLVIDGVIQPGNHPDPIKMLDISLLVTAGGQERTEREWQALLGEAGLALERIVLTASEVSIIEGKPY